MEPHDEQSLANFFLHIKDLIVHLNINEMLVFFSSLIKAKCFKWIDFTEFPNSPNLVPGKSLSSSIYLKIFPMYSLEEQGYLSTCPTQVF